MNHVHEYADSERVGDYNEQTRLLTTGKKTDLSKLYQSHNKTLNYEHASHGLRKEGAELRQGKKQVIPSSPLDTSTNRRIRDQDCSTQSEGVPFKTTFSQGKQLQAAVPQTPKNKFNNYNIGNSQIDDSQSGHQDVQYSDLRTMGHIIPRSTLLSSRPRAKAATNKKDSVTAGIGAGIQSPATMGSQKENRSDAATFQSAGVSNGSLGNFSSSL